MFKQIMVNLFRNPLRTFLTMASVTVALFLYCTLGGVLDTLQESIKVGSEARLVTRNKISLVQWMPGAYRNRIEAVPGVKRVALVNWFGGRDPADLHGFFAQFAVDGNYFGIHGKDVEIVQASPVQAQVAIPDGADPKLAAFLIERTACVVGEKLMLKKGWKLGQTVTLSGTIFPGDWPYTIRAVYRAKVKAFGEEVLFFHYDYLNEKGMGGTSPVGTYLLELADPSQASTITCRGCAVRECGAGHAHRDRGGVPSRVREHVRQHPVRPACDRARDRVQHPVDRREYHDDRDSRAHLGVRRAENTRVQRRLGVHHGCDQIGRASCRERVYSSV